MSRGCARALVKEGMIMLAATIALITMPAPAADMSAYLADRPKAPIQEDVRQVAKTECRAEADGPKLALLLACARESASRGAVQPLMLERTASAR
jgi:hypothetical protein